MLFFNIDARFFQTLCLVVLVIVITACQRNAPREVIFNEGGQTMSEIYRNQGARSVTKEVGFSNGDLDGYTRDANNEIDLLFPELENPRLTMYVFPHESPNGHPIPGYSTAFYLYETSQHFALPGEVLP